jgi:hypothetical protein
VKRFAFEAGYPFKWGCIFRGQDSDRSDEKLRPRSLAIFDLDLPLMLVLVVDRRADTRIELDILPQIKLIGDIVEVTLVLRLAGKMLFPVPFLQLFL